MDPNRNTIESCEKANELCTKAYSDYHNFINKDFVHDFLLNGKLKYKQGIMVDIHCQGHPEDWTEIGYLLSDNELNSNNLKASKSSIQLLASLSSYSFENLVRGDVSIGGILQNKFNLKAIPSPNINLSIS